jgi:hypothetical protein
MIYVGDPSQINYKQTNNQITNKFLTSLEVLGNANQKTCQQSGIVNLSNFYYKLVIKTTKEKEMCVWEVFVCLFFMGDF